MNYQVQNPCLGGASPSIQLYIAVLSADREKAWRLCGGRGSSTMRREWVRGDCQGSDGGRGPGDKPAAVDGDGHSNNFHKRRAESAHVGELVYKPRPLHSIVSHAVHHAACLYTRPRLVYHPRRSPRHCPAVRRARRHPRLQRRGRCGHHRRTLGVSLSSDVHVCFH